MLPETAFLTGPQETHGDICVAQEDGGIRVRWACSVVSRCWAGRDRREEARRSVAPLVRTEPDPLSPAQLSKPHKAQGPGLLQRNQLFPQLTCCCVILAGHEGAPQTLRAFPSEHRSSLRAVGTGLVQKAQHLTGLFLNQLPEGVFANPHVPWTPPKIQ